jgi:hypothetical protein
MLVAALWCAGQHPEQAGEAADCPRVAAEVPVAGLDRLGDGRL